MTEHRVLIEVELDRLRKVAEQKEQLSLSLETLLESLSDGNVALDFRGEIAHVSDSLVEPSFGLGSDDVGVDLLLLGQQLPEPILARLRSESEHATGERPHRFEIDWAREELGPRTYEVVATASHSPEEDCPPMTLFAFHDKTRLKSLEGEVERSRNLAAIGQMAATVAHELRNPLGAIQGFATLLRRDLGRSSALQKQVERILMGVDGANQIVEDLLEYSREIHLRWEPISIESLLAESLAAMQISPRWKEGVTIDMQIDPRLPSCRGDRRLLLQVLANLYNNAIDAMTGSGTLSVRARRTGELAGEEKVRIVIRDSGCGLDAEQVAKIFEPFFTAKAGGTGLGMAIVRRVVDAHEGKVHVVSAPGKGTSVVLDLPLAGVDQMRTEQEKEAA